MSRNTYTAENGFVITDDIVDKWAAEAEGNFSGAAVTEFSGRAWEDETQPLKPRTVRLSDTAVSYTHLTLPTIAAECRSRWSPYH